MTVTTLRRSYFAAALALLAGPVGAVRAADGPAAADFFESEVRPVLVESCLGCHGPKKQMGGLRLDSRAAVLAGGDGGAVVVPGQPAKSPLVAAVRHNGEVKMPPAGPLPARRVAALAKWVELGVPWPAPATPPTAGAKAGPGHWAFQPVRDYPVPETPNTKHQTPNEIDRFVLAKLAEKNLPASPPADRRTLIRRATYDLTGLPPTAAEVGAFVNDAAADSYAKLIDRLLASPAYGEQWGRHWLDVARYSDTKGYVYAREERFWVHAWAYRDWVVRALNDDLPYDRFLALQLAADQVAPDDPAAQAAMGYLTLGRRFLGVTHDIADDRIDVVTRGMMGLTVACARCHDHKFDPIPTADYYSLYGVFRSSAERVVPATTTAPDAAFAKGLADRQKKLADTTATRRAEAAARARARVGDYLAAQFEMHKYPEEGFDQVFGAGDLIPATARRWREYLARAADRRDPVFAAWHALAKLPADGYAALARDALGKLPPGGVSTPVAAAFATPPKDRAEVVARYAAVFARVERKWQAVRTATRGAAGAEPDGLPDPAEEAVRRVLYGPDAPCEVPDEPVVETENYFPSNVINELWGLQGEVDRWIIKSPAAPAYATVLVDRQTPADARVLRRGNPATPAQVVPRQFLEVLSGEGRKPFATGSGRRELAAAITNPANPLTARVIVNRVWAHHFGAGLVLTPSDFGTRAEPPSHPELLDWLAKRFIADGWSLKKLHRRVMLSAAYQQSSVGPADAAARARAATADAENRLVWRMNPRRLTFEELHDSLFAATGELDRKAGGKPVDLLARPFAPRRSIYGLIDRQFFADLLRTFDVANPDLHIPQRSETTVPQQALFFLNHPLLLDRAKALAQHPAVVAAKRPDEKVAQLYRLAYQRPPTANQLRAAVGLVRAVDEDAKPVATKPSAWAYGVAAFDPKAERISGFRPLPYFTGTAWQGGAAFPDGAFGWAQLSATGGHPGNDLGHAVVRRWTAPADGTVRVTSTLIHEEAAGDGVRATIVSSRHGRLKSATAHNTRAELTLPAVEVRAGDTLDFVVDIRGILDSDQFTWAPQIDEVRAGGRAWKAADDFGGPAAGPRVGPWEQLAQALLMANEFSFVD